MPCGVGEKYPAVLAGWRYEMYEYLLVYIITYKNGSYGFCNQSLRQGRPFNLNEVNVITERVVDAQDDVTNAILINIISFGKKGLR